MEHPDRHLLSGLILNSLLQTLLTLQKIAGARWKGKLKEINISVSVEHDNIYQDLRYRARYRSCRKTISAHAERRRGAGSAVSSRAFMRSFGGDLRYIRGAKICFVIEVATAPLSLKLITNEGGKMQRIRLLLVDDHLSFERG